MKNIDEDLGNYLAEIARRSVDGEIEWTQPNQSTFRWIKDADGTLLVTSIQKIFGPRRVGASGAHSQRPNEYIFQVQHHKANSALIVLSSEERPELKRLLEQIFECAESGMDRRSTEVLRRLLE